MSVKYKILKLPVYNSKGSKIESYKNVYLDIDVYDIIKDEKWELNYIGKSWRVYNRLMVNYKRKPYIYIIEYRN